MANLFDNKLFLQYLAAAGQDIGSGKAIGTNVNAVTNQSIQNQNFNNLMKKMLADAANPETDGKATIDGTNFSYKTSMGASPMAMTAAGKKPTSQPSTQQPTASPQRSSFLGPVDLSAGELAGLSPEMISQALGLKFQQQNLERQSINDLINNKYKRALTEQALASAERTRNPPVKDERTAAIQNYEYAKANGFKGNFNEFQNDARTSHIKDYEYAKSKGYESDFQSWLRDMTALGGGLSLAEYGARKDVDTQAALRKTVRSPEYISKLEKAAKADTSLDEYFGTDRYDLEVKKQVLTKLDNEIRNAYSGKTIERKVDGWYVDGKLIRRNPYAR